MRCEFCDERLSDSEPANLALLHHVEQKAGCEEQFGFLMENLRASWTRSMSGG